MPPTRTRSRRTLRKEPVTIDKSEHSEATPGEIKDAAPMDIDPKPPSLDFAKVEDCIWKALSDHWNSSGGVAKHAIDSYNHFINVMLPHIISENSDVTTMSSCGNYSFHLQFTNPCVHRPTVKEADGFERPIYPIAARYRHLSYCCSVVTDVVHDKICRIGEPKRCWRRVYREVVLARIPCMLGSNVCYLSDPTQRRDECCLEAPGYFIINGHEKNIIAQEKLRTNHAYVFAAKANSRQAYVCEVRSCHELKMRSTSTLYMATTTPPGGGLPDVVLTLPFLEIPLSLPIVFKALGCCSREEALDYIPCDDDPTMLAIVISIFESDIHANSTPQQMFEFIGREATREQTKERRAKYTEHILSNELLPHVSLKLDENSCRRKLHFLGSMLRSLLRVHLGKQSPSDRDSYANKRLDSAGTLMGLLFRMLFRNYLKSISVSQHRLVESGKVETCMFGDVAMTEKRITSGMKYSFATGMWGHSKGGAISSQNGVVQVMSRLSCLASMSSARRMNTPIAREGKLPAPRHLHGSSIFAVCPCETPEGGACGLVKNLALTASVRIGCWSTPIAQAILRTVTPRVTPLLAASPELRKNSTHLHVNGVIIGVIEEYNAQPLAIRLREMRRSQQLPRDISVTLRDRSLYVSSDPGGLTRPLIIASEAHRIVDVVENTPPHCNRMEELFRQGVLEMLDKDEEATMIISMRISSLFESGGEQYTHAELSPSLMLGISAALIPFSNFNQSPRNVYQSAMGKQSVGFYVTTWMKRMDAVSHILCTPQRQLVTTRVEQCLHTNYIPSGQMLMIAIVAYSGFNQEDSLILNKRAADLGALRSYVQRCFKDEEKAIGADSEKFCNPSELAECAGLRVGTYDKLNSEGYVDPGTTIKAGDALIGKVISTADVTEPNKARPEVKRDRSTLMRHHEDGVVDAVLTSRTRDGNRSVKVRVRSTRVPEIGDKLSSRHGQKGVIGDRIPPEDIMFCPETGLTPDILVNPHAIPSRMTIGMMVEAILSLLCAHEGRIGDGTPFKDTSIENIADSLEAAGFQRYGNRVMVNGQTGERMQSKLFVAPVWYQRLKHMSRDKIHSRSRGPVQVVTRQPVEGRSREGGLRFGEMERDCVIAHGASNVLVERLFFSSDPFQAEVCCDCGLLAMPAAKNMRVRNTTAHCRACGSTNVVLKNMPYAQKLLFFELMAMGIACRQRLTSSDEVPVVDEKLFAAGGGWSKDVWGGCATEDVMEE